MAEAPSRSTSIRSIAAVGIELRFVTMVEPIFGSLNAAGLMRRPLSSVNVPAEPRPRNATVALPGENPFPPSMSLNALPDEIDNLFRSSCTDVAPLRLISSDVMIVMGDAVSASTRLIFEPVTSIFSTFCAAGACCASTTPDVIKLPTAPAQIAASECASIFFLAFMRVPLV